MQPVGLDSDSKPRFKENPIVTYLLDWCRNNGGPDLNEIASIAAGRRNTPAPFTEDDRRQFAQLIGYSVGGYSELSYVDDEAWAAAFAAARQVDPNFMG